MLCVMTPHNFTDSYKSCGSPCCLHLHFTLKLDATAWCYICPSLISFFWPVNIHTDLLGWLKNGKYYTWWHIVWWVPTFRGDLLPAGRSSLQFGAEKRLIHGLSVTLFIVTCNYMFTTLIHPMQQGTKVFSLEIMKYLLYYCCLGQCS